MKNVLIFLTLIVLIGAFFSSCNNDDESEMNNSGIPTPTNEFYLLGTIDSDPILVESNNGTASDTYSACGVETSAYGGAWVKIESSTFDIIPLAYSYIHVLTNSNEELDDKFAAYQVGEKGIFDCSNGDVEGGEIIYIDGNDVVWSSNGPQDSDASFEVLERVGDWTGDIFTSSSVLEVKGKFNCTLYDDSGNSIKMTNGEFNSLYNFIM